MNTDDLEQFEAERELQLAQEYQDVVGLFKFAVETDRRFYLANKVDVKVIAEGVRPLLEVTLSDAWVWDLYRKSRFVPRVRVMSFKDLNIEELPRPTLNCQRARSSANGKSPVGRRLSREILRTQWL